MPSYCQRKSCRHVAIIMDGNGRWAVRRGGPRTSGHAAGAEAVRRVVEAAPGLGVETLTLFAFSAANWRRPPSEVAALLRLFHDYIVSEADLCLQRGVRMSLIGRRDRLPPSLRTAIAAIEQATRAGTLLHLRLAIDYSSRDAILSAARRMAAHAGVNKYCGKESCSGADPCGCAACGEPSLEDFSRLLNEDWHSPDNVPDVDLVIRTGGERRLSDFLLWESAFAELYFTDRMWPEFNAADLAAALDDFDRRERRFGRVTPIADAPAHPLREVG